MPKRFWSSSQKPKKNWEQYTARDRDRDPAHVAKSPSGGGGFRETQKANMEWGFDPWASPTGVTELDHDHGSNTLFGNASRGSSSTSSSVSGSISGSGSGSTKTPVGFPTELDPNINTHLKLPQSKHAKSRNAIKQRKDYKDMVERRQRSHSPSRSLSPHRSASSSSSPDAKTHIIPGVSQMTMRQILSVVFSAFWDRADLYTDVLGLPMGDVTDRELKLAFLRQGRIVLATPIESPDDMTMISAGVGGIIAGPNSPSRDRDGMSSLSVVQAGTPVSRKAKLKFQATSLAYELLKDQTKRTAYDEWRLWNSRLPPPPEMNNTSSQDKEDQELADSLSGRESPSGSPSLMYTPSVDSSNITSILRRPTATAKERRRAGMRRASKQTLRHDRKISWNEEVEELVITETMPHYDPLVDDPKENHVYGQYHGLLDPYGESAENWFGTVDNENSNSEGGMTRRERYQDSRPWLTSRSADPGMRDHPNVHNFNSLNSQTVTTSMEEHSSSGVVFEGYNPNDSLMVILDGPLSPERNTNKKGPPGAPGKGDSWTGFPDDELESKPTHGSWNNGPNEGGDSSLNHGNVKVNVNVMPMETRAPVLPRNPDMDQDDGGSFTSQSYSMQSTVSWNSVPTVEPHDDCDIGRTVDLARGFQATLSNYINSAVEDMKEGLQLMGKQWDEIATPSTANANASASGSSRDKKNFFFLETQELDAMMGILSTEMQSLTKAPCAQRDDRHHHLQQQQQYQPPSQQTIGYQDSAERKPAKPKRFFGNFFSK